MVHLLMRSFTYKIFGQTDRRTDEQDDSYVTLKTLFARNGEYT